MVTAGAAGDATPAGPRSPLGESRPLRAGRLGAVPGERGDTVRDRGGRRPTEHHVLQLPEPAPTLQARRRAGRPRRRRSDRHHRRARLGRPDRRSPTLHPARTGRAGPTGPSEGPVDPEAAARRAEARRDKVAAGLAELQLWLGDQVRTGLAGLPRAGYGHFDAIAARMVDAQAPGVAATLRALPADLVTADWPGRALHALGGLHLLAQAHQRLDDLPEELAATVRSRVGYPVSKETVRGRPAVSDRWWAIAAHRHRGVPAHHPTRLAARTRHRSLGDVADLRPAGPRPGPQHPAGPHVRLRGALLSRVGAVPSPDRATAAGSGPAAGVRG